MKSRGFTQIKPALIKCGFTNDRATYLAKTNLRFVNFDDLEKLCYHLNCTPNDLLSWKPDKNFSPPAEHALYKLKRTSPPPNLKYYEDKLPADLLAVGETLLKDLYERYKQDLKKQ